MSDQEQDGPMLLVYIRDKLLARLTASDRNLILAGQQDAAPADQFAPAIVEINLTAQECKVISEQLMAHCRRLDKDYERHCKKWDSRQRRDNEKRSDRAVELATVFYGNADGEY